MLLFKVWSLLDINWCASLRVSKPTLYVFFFLMPTQGLHLENESTRTKPPSLQNHEAQLHHANLSFFDNYLLSNWDITFFPTENSIQEGNNIEEQDFLKAICTSGRRKERCKHLDGFCRSCIWTPPQLMENFCLL